MTEPMKTLEQLQQDWGNSTCSKEPEQYIYDYMKNQVLAERERIKELESKLEYANALLAKYTPKDYGSDEPEFTHPDETED